MTLTTSNQEQDKINPGIQYGISNNGLINKDGSITLHGYIKLANFPGSIIIRTKNLEGETIGYAIRVNSRENFEGNKIVFGKNGEIKFTYQLHNIDEQRLEEIGILGEYKSATIKENSEKMDSLKAILMGLFIKGTRYDPFQGMYPNKEELENAKQQLSSLSILEQIDLAKYFYYKTIGENTSNIRCSYNVYGLFIDSPFGWKFWELEDKRLKLAGYKEGFYNLKPHNYKNNN